MSRPNKTEYAILGLLAMTPRSGYDIKKEVAGTLGHFWHESYGHIYPVLKRLHALGWIERRKLRQAGRPVRHLYSITEDGRAELDQWLGEPVDRFPPRNELLLKLFFGQLSRPADLRRIVVDYRDKQRVALAMLQHAVDELERDASDDPGLPYFQMTADLGLRATRAFLKWAEDTIRKLETMEEP